MVYICDEVASQIGTQMQSVIASQLFAPIMGEEFAVARMSALSTVTILVLLMGKVRETKGIDMGAVTGQD